MASDVNNFYQRFIELLKNDRTPELETLVQENREMAAKCHEKIKEKIANETEPDKAGAYRIVAEELEELLLVTSGKQNCDAAERIYVRAEKSIKPAEQLIGFKRVVRLCPTLVASQVSLGNVNKKLGKFEDAVAAYEKAITLKKDSSEACLGLGETLFAAGLCQRSLPYFDRAVLMDPNNSRAKKFIEMAHREIARDKTGLLSSEEIADCLQRSIGGNLMCMCPVTARLAGRVRLHEVTFSVGSANLSLRAKKQLQEAAVALQSDRLKNGNYLIEGHADSTGNPANNQILSQARSEAVKIYLTQILRVDPAVLSAAGMGDSRCWTQNGTSKGRRLNRRIEILRLEDPQRSDDLKM